MRWSYLKLQALYAWGAWCVVAFLGSLPAPWLSAVNQALPKEPHWIWYPLLAVLLLQTWLILIHGNVKRQKQGAA